MNTNDAVPDRRDFAWDDLLLDANEGPTPILPADLWPLPARDLNRYPDAAGFEAVLAGRCGVRLQEVLVTAGADDAIDRLCRRFLAGGRELVLTAPTFGMFAHYARLAGGRVRTVPWWEGDYPLEAVRDAIGPQTGLVVVVSPNNPTGAVVTDADLRGLAEACGPALLVLDAAYTEFADVDLTDTALALGAVVLRTFSKAWGLAGLRVGYALGPSERLAALRDGGPPYAVSGTSLAVAGRVLEAGDDAMREGIRSLRRHRTALAETLADLGLRALPSQGNFLLVRDIRAGRLAAALGALGVRVRTWPGDPLLHDCLRITCPAAVGDLRRLDRALRMVLAPEALLLDMDGVLADEGPSYRETVRAVLADEGFTVDRADLAAAKAAGGANDDWELTRRLLADRGRALPLEAVRDRFQRRYLGDSERPGLCARETLIPPRALLEGWAARLPLAVVTGRPRAEAEAFLDRFGLSDLFSVLVAREDAPAKPDPAPVRLALERLGVTRAWMVGDTPDDVAAARAAGVLPYAVTPPDPDDAPDPASLAGAVRVLASLQDLEEDLT